MFWLWFLVPCSSTELAVSPQSVSLVLTRPKNEEAYGRSTMLGWGCGKEENPWLRSFPRGLVLPFPHSMEALERKFYFRFLKQLWIYNQWVSFLFPFLPHKLTRLGLWSIIWLGWGGVSYLNCIDMMWENNLSLIGKCWNWTNLLKNVQDQSPSSPYITQSKPSFAALPLCHNGQEGWEWEIGMDASGFPN